MQMMLFTRKLVSLDTVQRIVVVSGGIVGGVDRPLSRAELLELRRRIHERISGIGADVFDGIRLAADPFMQLVEEGLRRFATYRITGRENIPRRGRIVIAPNHPLPFPDNFAVLKAVHTLFAPRPFAVIMNVNTVTQLFPDWTERSSFRERVIPVYREGGNSFGRVVNGPEVVRRAVDFLQSHENAVLIVAPEGSDSILQNWVLYPYAGFARIAWESCAMVVPIVTTGHADLKSLAFHVEIELLPPLSLRLPAGPQETRDDWASTLRKRFKGA